LLQFSVLSRLEKGKANAWRPGLGISKDLIESYGNTIAVTKKLETKVTQLQDFSDSKRGHFKNIGGGAGGEAHVVSISNRRDGEHAWKQASSSSRANGGNNFDVVKKSQECQTPADWVTINEVVPERDDASVSSSGSKKKGKKGGKGGSKRATSSGKGQGKRSKISGSAAGNEEEDEDEDDEERDRRKTGSATMTFKTPGTHLLTHSPNHLLTHSLS
jgi:hypothetical protein